MTIAICQDCEEPTELTDRKGKPVTLMMLKSPLEFLCLRCAMRRAKKEALAQ